MSSKRPTSERSAAVSAAFISRIGVIWLITLLFVTGLLTLQAPPSSAGFFDRHPKLRRAAKAAGIGALTGGLGTVFLGGSMVTHAVVGAGIHAGVSGAQDSKILKKNNQSPRPVSCHRMTVVLTCDALRTP